MFGLWDKFLNFLYELCYYIGIFFMKILHYLYLMFGVFAGTEKVTYYSSKNYLINIFFTNTTVTTVYAGMALIGFIMLMVMTIFAVYKKMHDLGDRMQSSLGEIIRRCLTSFLFIISMNVIMIATINFTNVLMRSVEYLFDNSYLLTNSTYIEFTSKQYAAMARIFNTIGNYSLSKSYTSRYNLNACFNDIRSDMAYLEDTKVFNFSYDYEVDGKQVETWQSVLLKIARTADLSQDLPLDEYNTSVSAALLDAMEYCRQNNNDMTVLQSYSEGSGRYQQTEADIDVLFWLAATTDAAHNESYNGEYADISDPVRNPYRMNERSIYSLSSVEEDFSLSFGSFNHLLIIIGGIMLCFEFLGIIINTIARLYNLLILYLAAPPIIATAPFDEGEKFRQWSQAFIIQAFGVFGTIIAIRVMMLLVPIIYDSNLIILSTGFFGMLAKTLLVFVMAYSARKASGLIGGIISGNGGGASAKALDTYDTMMNGTVGRELHRMRDRWDRYRQSRSTKSGQSQQAAPFSGAGGRAEAEQAVREATGSGSGSITNTGAYMRGSAGSSSDSAQKSTYSYQSPDGRRFNYRMTEGQAQTAGKIFGPVFKQQSGDGESSSGDGAVQSGQKSSAGQSSVEKSSVGRSSAGQAPVSSSGSGPEVSGSQSTGNVSNGPRRSEAEINEFFGTGNRASSGAAESGGHEGPAGSEPDVSKDAGRKNSDRKIRNYFGMGSKSSSGSGADKNNSKK